jgi:hypothetical protein
MQNNMTSNVAFHLELGHYTVIALAIPVSACQTGDIPMAKSNVKTQPAKPQVAPTGKVLPDQRPNVDVPMAQAAADQATPAKAKPAKAKAEWRGSLKAAGITVTPESRITFNDARYAAKPKQAGKKSAQRIEFYVRGPQGMSVAEHKACYEQAKLPKSFAMADLNWDFAHGYITVSAQEPVKS